MSMNSEVTHCASDGSWDRVKECRPSASRVELRGRFVQRGSARRAMVNSLLRMLVVLARARVLSALLSQNPKLLWRQYRSPLFV